MFPKFRLTSTPAWLTSWADIVPSGLPELCIVKDDMFPIVHPVLHLSPRTGKRVLSPMRFGLIPSYAHDNHQAPHLIEAHAEAMTCCNSFRSAFKRRRCLIPATAFYEFTEVARPGSKPSSFSLKTGDIFAIAGVWESWIDDAGGTVESFALIDVQPDPALHPHFDRIPVVIAEVDYEHWLSSQIAPLKLLRPLPKEELDHWKIAPDIPLSSPETRFADIGSCQGKRRE